MSRYKCPACGHFLLKELDARGGERKVELLCYHCRPTRVVIITLRGDNATVPSHIEAAGMR